MYVIFRYFLPVSKQIELVSVKEICFLVHKVLIMRSISNTKVKCHLVR